jgi:signal transduction histidine kinase
MSNTPLRLLLVEDDENDAMLLLRELRRGGYSVTSTRVETPEAFERELDTGRWDVIVADYSLPHFDALSAFSRVRQRGLDLPFLIVSGTIGEDTAVAAMKAGVHDFLLKDRLGRLAPAVTRELREAEVRAERQRMQEQLLLSDRLASLGLLAASVAHEINNPLASLMMDLDFVLGAQEAQATSGPAAQALHEARECAGRIRDIIRDIKIFSRPDEQRFGATDVHRVLDSSVRMARNHVFHRAQLVKDYGSVPAVHGNEARLGQVFLNLITNAAQAIPEGRSSEHEIRVVTRTEPDGTIRVDIRDTGTGIPPELRDRIFEPFFTTKPQGMGTGLGLSICRRLVNELGGSMGVENGPERGTIFWVRLRPAQASVPSVGAAKVERAAHNLRVLVIDDEVAIGRALKRHLARRYDVSVLNDAREALALITSGHRFDAILCDLMMPEMNGPQFHAELARQVPDQARRLTFMTGGAFTDEALAFLSKVRPPCLEKPIDLERLDAMIQNAA